MREFVVIAYGHPNIQANHKTTWQLTREQDLTPKGDCIIGVKSNYSTASLPVEFADHLKLGLKISYSIFVSDTQIITGIAQGHPDLILSDPVDIVVRKSEFLSPRTLAVNSNIVASDIPRDWIEIMQNVDTEIKVIFSY